MSHPLPGFTQTFTVPTRPHETFDAVANPAAWWNELIEGRADRVGDVFGFEVPDLHRARFEVIEANPHALAWKVIPFGDEHPTELEDWIGTVVRFQFIADPQGTRVTFTHQGLSPQLECYAMCSRAWAYHLQAGLQAMLSGGRAHPVTASNGAEIASIVGARLAA